MEFTNYHARYFAHELTKRFSSDSVDKLAFVLADAQVDLNPYQVEAALFAFRSPFSKGAILADEVGLGKTIEAGLLLSQNSLPDKLRISMREVTNVQFLRCKSRVIIPLPVDEMHPGQCEYRTGFHMPGW